MNACLFAGARASRKFAIGVAVADFEFFAGAGKVVMVCEVEVIEEEALRVLAMLLSW